MLQPQRVEVRPGCCLVMVGHLAKHQALVLLGVYGAMMRVQFTVDGEPLRFCDKSCWQKLCSRVIRFGDSKAVSAACADVQQLAADDVDEDEWCEADEEECGIEASDGGVDNVEYELFEEASFYCAPQLAAAETDSLSEDV